MRIFKAGEKFALSCGRKTTDSVGPAGKTPGSVPMVPMLTKIQSGMRYRVRSPCTTDHVKNRSGLMRRGSGVRTGGVSGLGESGRGFCECIAPGN